MSNENLGAGIGGDSNPLALLARVGLVADAAVELHAVVRIAPYDPPRGVWAFKTFVPSFGSRKGLLGDGMARQKKCQERPNDE